MTREEKQYELNALHRDVSHVTTPEYFDESHLYVGANNFGDRDHYPCGLESNTGRKILARHMVMVSSELKMAYQKLWRELKEEMK